MACSQKTKKESDKVEVKEVTLVDIVDDVPPPPPDLTPKFKTLQDWLFSICDGEKPKKPIANYDFELFESTDDNVISLVGINKYDNKDTSYTRIEFEPSNVYFQLPKSEYENLNREELLNKLTLQLKGFINTEKFKTSFLANADNVKVSLNGKLIWSNK